MNRNLTFISVIVYWPIDHRLVRWQTLSRNVNFKRPEFERLHLCVPLQVHFRYPDESLVQVKTFFLYDPLQPPDRH